MSNIDQEKRTKPHQNEWWRLEQLALVSQVATQVTKILYLDELFGLARLRTAVQANWREGPQAVVEALRHSIARFSISNLPADDFTLPLSKRG